MQASELWKLYASGESTVQAVKGVNVSIGEGEMIAIMGPSGCGKTTLLNVLSGIDEPTSGTVTIDDKSLFVVSDDERSRMRAEYLGFIFQDFNLLPVLSAVENVELPLLLHNYNKRERREKVQSALEQVGLSDRQEHFPKELSGGQEQRVAIARALVAEPLMIVADEPTGDLDRDSADEILDLLEKLSAEENKTIVMVTHDPKAAQRAKRCLELEKGKLVPNSEVLK